MPAFLTQMGAVLAGVGVSMVRQLVTERFLKRMVVLALEKLVNKTQDDWDNKLLEEAKRAWNVDSPQAK